MSATRAATAGISLKASLLRLRLLLACGPLLLALAGCGRPAREPSPAPPPSPATPTTLAPLQIEHVEVQVGGGNPAPVNAQVTGYLPDSCTSAREPRVNRSGDQITIEILGERPAGVACAQVVTRFQRGISLGRLPPGSYQLLVNGVAARFTVAG